MPRWPAAGSRLGRRPAGACRAVRRVRPGPLRRRRPAAEHDSCRVGSLAVSEPVDRGRHLGGGAALAQRRQQPRRRHRLGGLRPGPRARATAASSSTPSAPTAPRRCARCSSHLGGCRFYAADGAELAARRGRARASTSSACRSASATPGPRAGVSPTCARTPATSTSSSSSLDPDVLARYGRTLLAGERWLQRRTKYGELRRRRARRRPRRPRGRRPAGRRGGGRPGRHRRPPRRLPRRRPRGVLHRPRPPRRLALLPHARRARRARGQVRRQAPRLPRLDGRGPGRGQDLGLDAHDPRVPRLRAASGRATRAHPRTALEMTVRAARS